MTLTSDQEGSLCLSWSRSFRDSPAETTIQKVATRACPVIIRGEVGSLGKHRGQTPLPRRTNPLDTNH